MIDKQIVYSRIQEIEDSLDRLKKIGEVEEEVFVADNNLKDIASYRLLIIIEASISICQHICAREIHKAPESYADCFSLLEKNNIITKDISVRLQQMARFRNMLIHIYWDIDYSLVHQIIKKRMNDTKEFISQIAKKFLG